MPFAAQSSSQTEWSASLSVLKSLTLLQSCRVTAPLRDSGSLATRFQCWYLAPSLLVSFWSLFFTVRPGWSSPSLSGSGFATAGALAESAQSSGPVPLERRYQAWVLARAGSSSGWCGRYSGPRPLGRSPSRGIGPAGGGRRRRARWRGLRSRRRKCRPVGLSRSGWGTFAHVAGVAACRRRARTIRTASGSSPSSDVDGDIATWSPSIRRRRRRVPVSLRRGSRPDRPRRRTPAVASPLTAPPRAGPIGTRPSSGNWAT